MNTAKLASVLAVALSLQSAAFATQPSASGSGGVSIANTISGNFAVGQTGSSTSYAANNEAGTAKVTALANYTKNYGAVNAGIAGDTTSTSSGAAYNVSSGNGNGTASSIGSVNTGVHGVVAIHGVTTGFNGGNSNTQSNNQVDAGTNQGSYVDGSTKSGFNTQIQYSHSSSSAAAPAGSFGGVHSASVSVADQKTGYASGASVTGVLKDAAGKDMNAAGLANIGAAGQFFAKAGLSGSTGTVTAP